MALKWASTLHLHVNLRRTVGLNVRRFRLGASLSQEEMADRAKMHVSYLSGIENGNRNPTLEVISRLAKALKVEPWELLRSP